MSGSLPSKSQIRREEIMQSLKKHGRLTIADIVRQFGCSEATVRRDLEQLERQGTIIRTIGGVMFNGFAPSREASFEEKKNISWLEKERIAETAVGLIEEGDIIGLSGGTTTYLIAKALKHLQGITVVTNAVNIAMELSDVDDIQVVVTGGILRNKSFELCGPLAAAMIQSLHINKMFLGIDGITQAHGITTYSDMEAQIAQALIARSNRVYAVFDETKIGRASLVSIAGLDVLDGCITNASPSNPFMAQLRNSGVELWMP